MEEVHSIDMPDDIIRKIHAMFHFIGFWRIGTGVRLRQLSVFTVYVLLVSSGIMEACTTDKQDDVILLAVLILIGVVQTYRMYMLIWKRDMIVDLTQQILFVRHTNDFEVFSRANGKMKKLTMFAKCFMSIVFFAFLATVVLPVYENDLLVEIAFPLDYKSSRFAFWMANAFIAVGTLISVVCCMFVVIVLYMMLNIVTRFEILGSKYRNLGGCKLRDENGLQIHLSTREQQKLYEKQFAEAIGTYLEIHETVSRFTSTFSKLFLLQIICASLCITGSVYNLAFRPHGNLIQDGYYFVLLFYSLFDCFMIMYMGNEIELTSGKLGYCLFESDWMTQTKSCKKNVIIMVEQLKKPLELVVGILFPLNLETFTQIVNRAYSLFNILKNLKD